MILPNILLGSIRRNGVLELRREEVKTVLHYHLDQELMLQSHMPFNTRSPDSLWEQSYNHSRRQLKCRARELTIQMFPLQTSDHQFSLWNQSWEVQWEGTHLLLDQAIMIYHQWFKSVNLLASGSEPALEKLARNWTCWFQALERTDSTAPCLLCQAMLSLTGQIAKSMFDPKYK
mgnify:FL=1